MGFILFLFRGGGGRDLCLFATLWKGYERIYMNISGFIGDLSYQHIYGITHFETTYERIFMKFSGYVKKES